MKAVYAGYFWFNGIAQNVIYDSFPTSDDSESVLIVVEGENEGTQEFFGDFQTPGTTREVNNDFFMDSPSRNTSSREALAVIAEYETE